MVRTASSFTIKLFELFEIQTLHYGIDNTNRVIFRDVLIGIEQKKQPVVVTVIFCM